MPASLPKASPRIPSDSLLDRPGWRRFLVAITLVLLAATLTGCDTAKERAEAHYQRGMELIAAGDDDRALVEFRNVFRLDGTHLPARLEYARVMRQRGDQREAMAQYLRVVDLDPGNLEGQRAVIEIALRSQDFTTAQEHLDEAWRLAPKDPGIRALKATLDYRDPARRGAAVALAREVLVETPDNVAASLVLVADRLNSDAPAEALPIVDAALALAPKDQGLHLARLATLEKLGRTEESGAELRRMAELYPDDAGVRQALIQWYLRAGDIAGAEAVLRAEAARTPSDPKAALDLAQFIMEYRGTEAARAELETRITAAQGDVRPFQRARAGLDFLEGRTEAAIAEMRGLLEGAEPSDETDALRVALAQMLADTGQTAEASALLARVLTGDEKHPGDPDNVEALKLRAKIAIDADHPEQAIQDMRTASTNAPRDPEVMTIMALAHEREGRRELAGERLALAVEFSNQAPEESLRYANFLMRDKRVGPAEGVVTDALRHDPENRDLLLMLGQIHLERQDWTRVDQVAAILRKQGNPQSDAMAASLETASLEGQGRTDDVIKSLEGLAGPDGANGAAMTELMRGYVAKGDLAAARRYVDGLLAQDPRDPGARLMLAGLDQLSGDEAGAEAIYRAIPTDFPDLPQGYQALYGFLSAKGRKGEAEATLDAGLKALPDNADLLFLKAGALEGQGQVEGAITIYETLYARDSSSPVLANNLASLLASYRDDPASLDRAFAIARRLAGSDVPFFQDTYGWILHRRGDDAQALTYLEPAAKALPDNALTQFHLAEVQFALGQRPEARASYARALAAQAAGSPLPQESAARQRIAEIDAAPQPPGKG